MFAIRFKRFVSADFLFPFKQYSLTTEKRLREEARREEERVRKHTHEMSMNIMRARVKSAHLLLEGRSLSAKY